MPGTAGRRWDQAGCFAVFSHLLRLHRSRSLVTYWDRHGEASGSNRAGRSSGIQSSERCVNCSVCGFPDHAFVSRRGSSVGMLNVAVGETLTGQDALPRRRLRAWPTPRCFRLPPRPASGLVPLVRRVPPPALAARSASAPQPQLSGRVRPHPGLAPPVPPRLPGPGDDSAFLRSPSFLAGRRRFWAC